MLQRCDFLIEQSAISQCVLIGWGSRWAPLLLSVRDELLERLAELVEARLIEDLVGKLVVVVLGGALGEEVPEQRGL